MHDSDTTITIPNNPPKDALIDAAAAAVTLDAPVDSVVNSRVVGAVVPTGTVTAADEVEAVAVTVTLAADIAVHAATGSVNAASQEAGHGEMTAPAGTGPDAASDDSDLDDDALEVILRMHGMESRGPADNTMAPKEQTQGTSMRPKTGPKPVTVEGLRKEAHKKEGDKKKTDKRATQGSAGQPEQGQSRVTPAQGTSGSQHIHGQSQTSHQQGSSQTSEGSQSSGTASKGKNKLLSPVKGFFTSSSNPKQ
ncbi:hypothetical protein PsYK624_022200 [Phanerochaete sordida]|uniref:Uncharacterized protein n=1 Tax=Phanerochaete sordida TaxID=48140 RepID=A0A9P3L8I8_9APHY|nr:hypothetical protein PsYK624_022200 [Phanerochaete sordida]